MHFSSLGLLGLHFANPQSAHQQLSWWPHGTAKCMDEGRPTNLTQNWSTQLRSLNSSIRELTTQQKRLLISIWKWGQLDHNLPFSCITSLPKKYPSLDKQGIAYVKGSVESISYHDSLIQHLLQFERKLGTSVKIKDVNTFMPVKPSDENKWRAWESIKISFFGDICENHISAWIHILINYELRK